MYFPSLGFFGNRHHKVQSMPPFTVISLLSIRTMDPWLTFYPSLELNNDKNWHHSWATTVYMTPVKHKKISQQSNLMCIFFCLPTNDHSELCEYIVYSKYVTCISARLLQTIVHCLSGSSIWPVLAWKHGDTYNLLYSGWGGKGNLNHKVIKVWHS